MKPTKKGRGQQDHLLRHDTQVALSAACLFGDVDELRRLADRIADLNQTYANLWTPAHDACYSGHAEIIQMLSQLGANVSAISHDELTPACIACTKSHSEVIRMLGKRRGLGRCDALGAAIALRNPEWPFGSNTFSPRERCGFYRSY